MSIVVKYKLTGSLAFKEYSIQYSELPVSFSTDGLRNDDFMIHNSVDNSRRFLSMFNIIGNFTVHVCQILKNDTEYFKISDITHIEVIDNHYDNLLLFEKFKTTSSNNNQTQNLICLDYRVYNINNTIEGDLQNSYFNPNFGGGITNLQSFVCNYPCLFSPYYSHSFHGSTTLTHVSFNLQQEANGSPVTIPSETFASTKIICFESSEVTQVNDNAFNSCSNLKRVFLPKCTTIHNGGFRKCLSLENLSIPSITAIYNETTMDYVSVIFNLNDATIGSTTNLKCLVLPYAFNLFHDNTTTKNYIHSEIDLLKKCIIKNNGTIDLLSGSEIANYIFSNTHDICRVSMLDIDSTSADLSFVVVACQSVMKIDCFQGITFDIDSNGDPKNFIIVDNNYTPFNSLPVLHSNTTIADDFINDTLGQLGVSFSSVNINSIASYKANLLTDINTKIKSLLFSQKEKICETLFNFSKNTYRVAISDDGASGTLNMSSNDKIKFIIRLISGNGFAYDKSYEIVYSLQ
jgi:hypothetical protein